MLSIQTMRDILRLRAPDVVPCSLAAFYETLAWSENMSYDQRLKFLDVPSLELKAPIRADLYWCYKILFGLVEIT